MTTFFLTCAVLGGVIMVAQLLLGALGADGHDAADHDSPSDGASDGLQLFSVRALSAGTAFFGIGGLGASAAGAPTILALPAGALLGASAMFVVAYAMRTMLRMERDATVQVERAVGLTATVYVPVPPALAGVGKVLLTQRGRTVEYQAVTAGDLPLATGDTVVVVDVREQDILEVVTLPSLDGVL